MSILDVVYRVAHKYKGGIRALAARMNKNSAVLNNKINVNCDTHHLNVEELAMIADFCNTDEIAKWFAAQRGLLCTPMIQFDGVSDQALLDLFLKLEKEKGEWAGTIKKSLEDGYISPKEFEEIKKESLEFREVIAECMNRLGTLVQNRPKRNVSLINKSN